MSEQKAWSASRKADLPTESKACERHGAYRSLLIGGRIWTKCPKCVEAEVSKEQAAQAAREAEERQRRWQKQLGSAGIPERFQDRTFDTFRAETDAQRAALAFAREYATRFDEVRQEGRCALFIGAPGTGKTHLSAAIGMHLLRKGRTVNFTTVYRGVQRVLDTRHPGSRLSWSQAVELLTEPDLLILDEVGMQLGSEFEQTLITDALNNRYERRRPVLMLSNLKASEVRDYLGARVMDRMREGGGRIVPFEWDSYRGRV